MIKIFCRYIRNMPKDKAVYYGIKVGRRPGIYSTWREAELQVKAYPGAVFKKFKTVYNLFILF